MLNYVIFIIKSNKRFFVSILNWFRYWLFFVFDALYVSFFYIYGWTFYTYFFGIICVGFLCSYLGEFAYLTFKFFNRLLKRRKVNKNA